MRFEWDDRKNVANMRKHGMDFSHAAQMFSGAYQLLIEPDMREDYGEDRWKDWQKNGSRDFHTRSIVHYDPNYLLERGRKR
jgi:uncharacterized DUF497 family protein